jgi:hypothetical protein
MAPVRAASMGSPRLVLLAVGLAATAASAQTGDDRGDDQVRTETVTTRGEFPRIHLIANGFVDLAELRVAPPAIGFELGATYAPTSWLDLGLGARFGNSIGLMLLVDAHLPWRPDVLVRPFLQVRGLAHFASAGYGGGAWAGAELELGPGRLKLGPAAALYAPVEGYLPYALEVAIGYELDLLRPAADTEVRTERVVIREKMVEAPARKAATILKGRLVDLDDKPINGVVRVQGKAYDASNSFELELPAGDYRAWPSGSSGAPERWRRLRRSPSAPGSRPRGRGAARHRARRP